jgi:hypothetical protein
MAILREQPTNVLEMQPEIAITTPIAQQLLKKFPYTLLAAALD